MAKDVERKEMVRVMLNHIRGMKMAATYKILSKIAVQFAAITGVTEDQGPTPMYTGQAGGSRLDEKHAALGQDETAQTLVEISDIQEDWFANATSSLGLDFFELQEGPDSLPLHAEASTYPELYGQQPTAGEVDDWTARTLRGMHSL